MKGINFDDTGIMPTTDTDFQKQKKKNISEEIFVTLNK